MRLRVIAETLTSLAPAANGQWVSGPPGPQHTDVKYKFSLPSDPDPYGSLPYYVRIEDGSISFGHEHTGLDDRTTQNARKKNLAYELFPIVQYCIKTYIDAVQPDILKWVPMRRSEQRPNMSDKLALRNAREGIYDKLAKRSLETVGYIPFPNSNSMYVRRDDAERIIADYYDKASGNSNAPVAHWPDQGNSEWQNSPGFDQETALRYGSDNDERPGTYR